MRPGTRALVAVVAVTVAACSPADGAQEPSRTSETTVSTMPSTASSASSTTSTPTSTTTSTPTSTTSPTSTLTTLAPETRAAELCASETTFVLGVVENPALDEASGVVASRRHRGVIWAHNDGAETPGVFAIATDGRDLGFHPVEVDGVVDVEDIAIVPGRTAGAADDILLADIGDNGANRPSIRIYRFAEPDPGVVGPIGDVEVLEFTYPDRAHNAETLLVDDLDDRIVIVTKEQLPVEGLAPELRPTAPSLVFEGALSGHGSGPLELMPAGVVDTQLLETRTVADEPHPASVLGFGGVPTGGDVSPDGTLIAMRTYETIWLWPRPSGRSVAESLGSEPCQVRVAAEGQGEAVGFLGDGLITVSEGSSQPLFELRP